jgi:acetyltransferase-like isoleucine patch superfamily enzyme
MTPLGRLVACVPAFHTGAIAASLWLFVARPSLVTGLAVGAAVYALPLGVFRVLNRWRPLREGRSRLDAPVYSPWWASHQCQLLFIALPQLESVLQLLPGCFSLWLRLWGSRVGRAVHWTPRVEIADRSLLEIGDRVIVGHKVEMYAHVIRPTRAGLVLHVRRIVIGRAVFVGAGSRIGPGVHIDDGVHVPLLSDVYPHSRLTPVSSPPPARHAVPVAS